MYMHISKLKNVRKCVILTSTENTFRNETPSRPRMTMNDLTLDYEVGPGGCGGGLKGQT